MFCTPKGCHSSGSCSAPRVFDRLVAPRSGPISQPRVARLCERTLRKSPCSTHILVLHRETPYTHFGLAPRNPIHAFWSCTAKRCQIPAGGCAATPGNVQHSSLHPEGVPESVPLRRRSGTPSGCTLLGFIRTQGALAKPCDPGLGSGTASRCKTRREEDRKS